MTGYYCKACEAPATVDADGLHRSCGCNTTVIAGMSGTVRGRGAVSETSGVFAMLHALGLKYLNKLKASRGV